MDNVSCRIWKIGFRLNMLAQTSLKLANAFSPLRIPSKVSKVISNLGKQGKHLGNLTIGCIPGSCLENLWASGGIFHKLLGNAKKWGHFQRAFLRVQQIPNFVSLEFQLAYSSSIRKSMSMSYFKNARFQSIYSNLSKRASKQIKTRCVCTRCEN